MKSILKENEKPEWKYPVIMKRVDGSLVVLFTSVSDGTVLNPDDRNGIGSYSDSWIDCTDADVWEKLDGTITLQND